MSVCVYTLALVLLLPHDASPLSKTVFVGEGGDPSLFIWAIAWFPYAIAHGWNPLVTHAIWAPQGFNLTWNTSVPSLAILAWPLTASFGPVISYNLVSLAAPVFAAAGAFLLCDELTGSFVPALAGGWIYGFSPYEAGQLLGHLHLTFIAPVPVLVWLAVRVYKGKTRPWVAGLAGGLCLAFLLGVSVEVLATFTIFAVLALALALAVTSASAAALRVTVAAGGAYVVGGVVASPFLYYFFFVPSHAPAFLAVPSAYSADLLNFVLPTSVTALGSAAASPITAHFVGNLAEDGAYIGIPLLLIIGMFSVRHWKEPWGVVLLVVLAFTAVASLGPVLHVGGVAHGQMPWAAAVTLPLLKNALPVRFAMYIDLVGAVIAALWLAERRGYGRLAGIAVVALAIVSLWPSAITLTSFRVPAVFSMTKIRSVLEPGENVVVLPFGRLGQSMLWQADDRMYFRMAGGRVSFVPTNLLKIPAVAMFLDGPVPRNWQAEVLAYCKHNGVGAILVGAGTAPALAADLKSLDWKRSVVGGTLILEVP